MTQSSRSLRAMESTDAAAIYQILQDSETEGGPPTGPRWSERQVVEECAQGLGWVCAFDDVASKPGRVAAFILCRDLGAAWEIGFLATAPDARGQGLMRSLVEQMIQELPPGKEIWLEVHENNHPARRLYEKNGFRKTGQRSRYYRDGGTAVLYSYKPAE